VVTETTGNIAGAGFAIQLNLLKRMVKHDFEGNGM